METKTKNSTLKTSAILTITICLIATLYYTNLKFNQKNLQNVVAGSAADISTKSEWDSTNGKVITTITLGKATTDSIVAAKNISDIASLVASSIDIASNIKSISKGLTSNITAKQFYLNYFDIDKLLALDPTTLAKKTLGLMTSVLSKKVDQNCLTKTVLKALKSSKNKDKGVTIYRSTNFFSENSKIWNGYYNYSQNEWGTSSKDSSCKENKVCLEFLYYDGKTTGCWF